jgi:uncharacterized DUF497 family protein
VTTLDPEFEFEFEWDPAKSARNLSKHGIDFYAARAVFGDPYHIEVLPLRADINEIRRKVVGNLGEEVFTVICTDRALVTRIISARKARRNERRAYRESQTAL